MYLYLLGVLTMNALLLHEVCLLPDSLLLVGTEDREYVTPTISSNCHDRFVPKVFVCYKLSATAVELRLESKTLSVYHSIGIKIHY
jgi:hypothetical protein